MSRRLILNAAMIPNPGNYDYRLISQQEAITWLQGGQYPGDFESFVGYPDNAKFLSEISGVNVPVNRGECKMNAGDEALVMRLKYRVVNPATKGAPVNPEDYEFGLLLRGS